MNTVIRVEDAETGSNKGMGRYHRLLTSESCGAQNFSLCMNTLKAGVSTPDIFRSGEQGWYILSGTGRFHIGGESHPISPGMAVFAPASDTPHRFDVDAEQDLAYVLVFAPPN